MREIALVCAILAVLLPVGAYCLILASINRRGRPLLVSGAWDSVGLLFAAGGFFVVTVPMLISEFYLRTVSELSSENVTDVWMRHWILWLVYLLMLISGSALMILWRSHKTMIYNVDSEQFDKILEQTLSHLGLMIQKDRQRLILSAAKAGAEQTGISEQALPQAKDDRYAELAVEPFASLCHVTLHWDNYALEVREQVERELDKELEPAAPLDNPAAGWFLSISGLVFGFVVMLALTIAFLIFFVRH